MLKKITKFAISVGIYGLSLTFTNAQISFVGANAQTGFNNLLVGVAYSTVAFSDVNSDSKPDVLITGLNTSNVRIAKLYTNSGTNLQK